MTRTPLLVLLCAAAPLLGASTPAFAQSPAPAPTMTNFATVKPVGSARSYRVTPRRPIRIRVAGVGTLSGPRGAVTRSGRLRVQRYRSTKGMLTPAGLGVDVSFSRTRLRRPLTLAQRAGRRPAGSIPLVAHRRDDGTWELRPARIDRRGRIVIKTKSFSLNVPSWLDPKAWVQGVGNFLAQRVGGRTSPVTCPRPAPQWFDVSNSTVTAHACGQDNPDGGGERAEVRIKNNRNTVQQVTLAGPRDYVYVEGQPDALRRAIGALTGTDWNNTVFLSPGDGGYMTIGYRRPAGNVSYTTLVETSYRSVFLNFAYIAIDFLADDVADKVKLVAAVKIAQDCLGVYDIKRGTVKDPKTAVNAKNFAEVFGCVAEKGGEQLSDPKKALAAALELTDGKLAQFSTPQLTAELTKVGGNLNRLGRFLRVLNLLPILQQTVQGPIDVAFGQWFNGGNGTHVDVHMTGRVASGGSTGGTGGTGGSGGTGGAGGSTGGSGGSGGTGTGGGTTTSPPPPPQTWAETTGGETHTWTNWTNAGGYEGPVIPARTTVQIACKLPGFRVADGNTWWYRIAQAPWNGNYYASADAFYNNGATSGPLRGTPFVDAAVRDC